MAMPWVNVAPAAINTPAGVLIAAGATFTQGIAILLMNFALFCVASMCLGIAQGCAGFYRYAAADSAEESQKSRAISYVLAGGLLAAASKPPAST